MWDQRRAEGVLDSALFEPRGVFKNDFVIYTRILLMLLRVCQFDVHIDEIAEGDDLLEGFSTCISRRFNSGMHLPTEHCQKPNTKIGLQKGFTSGQRNAAAHGTEEVFVFEQLFCQILGFPLHPRRADKILRADMQTPPDLLAFGVVAWLFAKPAGKAAVLL